MYDINRKRAFQNAKVRDLIEVLKALPPDAQIVCDGDEWFWLHVEKDLSVVNIDSTEMDDEYEDEEGGSENATRKDTRAALREL